MIEEGGEGIEQDNRELRRIVAYNDCRMGLTNWMDKRERSEVRVSGTSQELNWKHMTKEILGNEGVCNDVHTYHSNTYPEKVFQALKEFYDSSILTDLTLITENGKSFHVHSVVLAAVSSFILATLRNKERSEDEKNVGVPTRSISLATEVDCVGLQAVVEFAYTGAVLSLNEDTMAQIQTAAQVLEIPRLMALCIKEERTKDSGSSKMKQPNICALEEMKTTLQGIEQLWVDRVGCDVSLDVDGALLYG